VTDDDRSDLAIALVSAEARLRGSRVSGHAVTARVNGVPLTYRFMLDAGARVTHVDVPLSTTALTVWVHVTRDGTVHSDVDPPEVRAELFDQELRDLLAAEFPVAISVLEGRLRLERPQWIESPGGIGQLAELAAMLARRIEDAFARAEARRAAEGSPYRGR
jgi:hypothetical protein